MNKSIFLLTILFLLTPGISWADFSENAHLVKLPDQSTVYLIKDGYRYSFPLQSLYEAYYGPDFSQVQDITASALANVSLRGNVFPPVNTLVKMESDSKVYDVIYIKEDLLTANIRWIRNEQDASVLYGINWSSKIITIPDSLWFNYREIPYFDSSTVKSSPTGEFTTGQWLEIIRFKITLYNDSALPIENLIGNFNNPTGIPDFDQCYLNYSYDQSQWFLYDNDPHYPDYFPYGGLPAYVFANTSLTINPQQEIYFSWNCFIPDRFKNYSGYTTIGGICPITNAPECIDKTAVGNQLSFK